MSVNGTAKSFYDSLKKIRVQNKEIKWRILITLKLKGINIKAIADFKMEESEISNGSLINRKYF